MAEELFETSSDKPDIELIGEVGKHYFVRTVTFAYIGRLSALTSDIFQLDNATWIAATGPFGQFVRTGDTEEKDSYPCNLKINLRRALIIETFEWPSDLPDSEPV